MSWSSNFSLVLSLPEMKCIQSHLWVINVLLTRTYPLLYQCIHPCQSNLCLSLVLDCDVGKKQWKSLVINNSIVQLRISFTKCIIYLEERENSVHQLRQPTVPGALPRARNPLRKLAEINKKKETLKSLKWKETPPSEVLLRKLN